MPIIDIHVHTFNARYLPIQNILLGKRDATPWAIFLYDAWAKRIAAGLVDIAKLAEIPREADARETRPLERYREQQAELCKTAFEGNSDDVAKALRDDCLKQLRAISGELSQQYAEEEATSETRLDAAEVAANKILTNPSGDDIEKLLGKLNFLHGRKSLLNFLLALVTLDGDMESRYHRDFDHQIRLFASHMMDLAPTYGQAEGTRLLEDFASSQVPRMHFFQSRQSLEEQGAARPAAQAEQEQGSRMLYFVAYNPFRDNGGTARFSHIGDALALVREAVDHHGAYGVKVYPPSGYRPTGNQIPKKPFTLFTDAPIDQWKRRYEGVTEAQLDTRLDELFAYCAANDLPIMAHCNTGEFEARKGYGVCMADPRWWRPVLERYPKLRICFGHAGGEDFWFGTSNKYESWGRLVYEYCVTYPNAYCDFSVLHGAGSEQQKEHFIAVTSALITEGLGIYPFEEKILFGTDWFMPIGLDEAQAYLNFWQTAFLDPRLAAYYRGFFFENALQFLNAAKRLDHPGSLPPQLTDNLRELLALSQRPRDDNPPSNGEN